MPEKCEIQETNNLVPMIIPNNKPH
jgi:hypothetical protein